MDRGCCGLSPGRVAMATTIPQWLAAASLPPPPGALPPRHSVHRCAGASDFLRFCWDAISTNAATSIVLRDAYREEVVKIFKFYEDGNALPWFTREVYVMSVGVFLWVMENPNRKYIIELVLKDEISKLFISEIFVFEKVLR